MSRPDRHFEWQTIAPQGDHVAGSASRLGLLFALFVLALTIIFARATQLELTQGAAFRLAAARPGQQIDLAPADRGSILARDGTVLAEDERVVSLEMHYRWIEEPPNAAWLKRQARRRLTPAERRRAERVAECEAALLAEREAWRRQLAAICGLTEEEWRRRAARIQARVEAIAQRVNLAHADRLSREQRIRDASAEDSDSPAAGSASGWRRLAADLFAIDGPATPERMLVGEELAFHVLVPSLSERQAAAIRDAFRSHGKSRGGLIPAAAMSKPETADSAAGARLCEHVRRSYPQGMLAANIVGHVAQIDPPANSPQAAMGRSAVAAVCGVAGVAGIERTAEALLRGEPGRRVHLLNQRGQRVGTQSSVEPRRGEDVRLTIDPRVQAVAEGLLDRALASSASAGRLTPVGGAIVVMDVWSGELLAAASAPRFDPNLFAHADETASALLAAPGQPLFDRTARMAIPPGSVFKIVSAIALLEAGVVTPETNFDCQGYLREPDRMRCALFRHQGVGHGSVRIADALATSCNTYFFHYAELLGPGPLVAWAEQFGVSSATGSGLADESAGRLATPGSIARLAGRPWQSGDTQGLAVGQGYLTATPLQVVRWIAAIANGGYLVTPRVLAGSGSQNDSGSNFGPGAAASERGGAPRGKKLLVSTSNLEAIRAGLRQTVADPDGTGHAAARLSWPTIAGKTGTAEVGGAQAEHAWFAGYVPAEEPRWAIVVALEHGGSGATAAGPLLRQLAQSLDELRYVAAP